MIGFHPDATAAQYHADEIAQAPSLSSSISKILLQQTPRHAWIAHPRLNPNFEPSDESKFDLGSVAHELILGKGGGFEIIVADDWRTKIAKDAREAAHKAGLRAVLEKDMARAVQMADAVSRRLRDMGLDFTKTANEQVFLWQEMGGAWCRAMTDALDLPALHVFDLKTTAAGLSDEQIKRTIENLGYDLSAGHYLRGLSHAVPNSSGRWKFFWVFVETDEPHEIRVIEADRATIEIGDRKAATAIVKWARAMATGEWPGYAPEVTTLGLSDYAISRWTERELVDPDCMVAPFASQSRPVERAPKKIVYGAG